MDWRQMSYGKIQFHGKPNQYLISFDYAFQLNLNVYKEGFSELQNVARCHVVKQNRNRTLELASLWELHSNSATGSVYQVHSQSQSKGHIDCQGWQQNRDEAVRKGKLQHQTVHDLDAYKPSSTTEDPLKISNAERQPTLNIWNQSINRWPHLNGIRPRKKRRWEMHWTMFMLSFQTKINVFTYPHKFSWFCDAWCSDLES